MLGDLVERMVQNWPDQETLRRDLWLQLQHCKTEAQVLECVRKWVVGETFAKAFVKLALSKSLDGFVSDAWQKWVKVAGKFDPIRYSRITLWNAVHRSVFRYFKPFTFSTVPLHEERNLDNEDGWSSYSSEGGYREEFVEWDEIEGKAIDVLVVQFLFRRYGNALNWIAKKVSPKFSLFLQLYYDCDTNGRLRLKEIAHQLKIKPASLKVEIHRWRRSLEKEWNPIKKQYDLTDMDFVRWVLFSLQGGQSR